MTGITRVARAHPAARRGGRGRPPLTMTSRWPTAGPGRSPRPQRRPL